MYSSLHAKNSEGRTGYVRAGGMGRRRSYHREEGVTYPGQIDVKGTTEEPMPAMDTDGASTQSAPLSVGPALPIDMETAMSRHDLAVIQFFNRLDRLFGDQIDARDREIVAKDRLISELERRAQIAEEHASLLKEYIASLSPGMDYKPGADRAMDEKTTRRWWRFWS